MHRTWSYNEISRRYTSDDIEFYTPTELRKQSTNNRQASIDEKIYVLEDWEYDTDSDDWYITGNPVSKVLDDYFESCLRCYNQLLEQEVSREQARMVLPQSMYTMFYATVNLHNLFHFLDIRNSPHAQYEMRLYAQALEDIIKDKVPASYKFWKELNNGHTNKE